MSKKAYKAKKVCFEQLLLNGSKGQLAKALAVETLQYTRYDLVHSGR